MCKHKAPLAKTADFRYNRGWRSNSYCVGAGASRIGARGTAIPHALPFVCLVALFYTIFDKGASGFFILGKLAENS